MKQTVEFLESFVVVVLVLIGLAGLSYRLLRDEGWLEDFLGGTWDFTVRYPLIAVPLLVGGLVLGRLWRNDRVAHGKQSSIAGTVVLYLVVAAGIYFTGHYVLAGTF